MKNEINLITQQLTTVSDTPRLDAELLTASILQRSRAWLLAHWEEPLSASQLQQLQDLAARRAQGEPIAYILGHKEFWSLKLNVDPHVLAPRPETEHLIEWILAKFADNLPFAAADLGTGSGAIALALAVERPLWQIDATDHSLPALSVAKQNAKRHRLDNINFYFGDWCKALPNQQYDLIVSNPPYIAEDDPHLQALTHEPSTALCSGHDGLNAIRIIIETAPYYLKNPGYLILEHGYDQARAVTKLLREQAFTDVQTHLDLAHQPRFVTACQQFPLRYNQF